MQARQDALRQIDTKLTNLKLAAGDLRSAAHLVAHADRSPAVTRACSRPAS